MNTDVYDSSNLIPHGSSRAVELMFGMQNEKNFQCSHQLGMGLEIILVQTIHHVQEVFHITHICRGNVVVPPNSMAIGVGSKGRYIT